MRVQTAMAREGLRLAEAIPDRDGRLLFGRGTELTQRRLVELYTMGVRVLEVEDDATIEPWEEAPEVDAWRQALEARFERVSRDKRMTALKTAVADVYEDFLLDLEASVDKLL